MRLPLLGLLTKFSNSDLSVNIGPNENKGLTSESELLTLDDNGASDSSSRWGSCDEIDSEDSNDEEDLHIAKEKTVEDRGGHGARALYFTESVRLGSHHTVLVCIVRMICTGDFRPMLENLLLTLK